MKNFLDLEISRLYPEPLNEQFIYSFFNRLYMNLHVYNFSMFLVWFGKHRTGKSISSLVFSIILDPTFLDNMENRIVYSVADLKKQARIIRDKKIKGASIIYDEAGSGELSNQRWYESKAKEINAILQSLGYLNPFLNFVTQDFTFINSQARKLSHGIFECKRTNNKYTIIKPLWLSNDPWSSKPYRHYPIFCESINDDVVSNVYKIGKIRLGRLLDSYTEEKYEAISKAFKNKLLDEEDDIGDDDEDTGSVVDSVEDAINDILTNPEPVTAKVKGRFPVLNPQLIAFQYRVSYRVAQAIKIKAEKQFRISAK